MSGIMSMVLGAKTAIAAAIDAYFNRVTLLLPGDGTNGAQNNTFLDSSSNNFTITRNGNTTQGTFSPFSQTGWSVNVTSNSGPNCLSYGTSTNLALGAGDFCAEAFVYMTSAASGAILDWRTNGGTTANVPVLYVNSSGTPIFEGTGGSVLITGSSSVQLNTWTHIALVRSGTTITIYLNGVSVGTATSNTTNFGIGTFNVNNPQSTAFCFVGYISNVRLVKGSAVYTSSFTPPTSPLTAITNTQLLTCQDNRFKDNSSNAFAITVNGTPSVQAFSPFAPTAAYSAATNGGSGYFDGSGDYLSVADSIALDLPGDFTLEGWVYFTDVSTNNEIFGLGQETSSNNGFSFYWAASTVNKLRLYSNGATIITGSTTLVANTWYHLALVRSGSGSNNLVLYVNGVSDGTATNTTSFTGTASNGFAIGANYATSYTATYSGYLAGVRLVKGQALTSGAFTIPTAPATTSAVGWSGANAASSLTGTISILANFTNAGILDATGKNALETVGNAQISTTQSKWGGGSIAYDGTGDYVFRPSSAITSLEGDFTVEGWAYRVSGGFSLLCLGDDFGSSGFHVYYSTGNNSWNFGTANASRINGGSTSTNTWLHIAVTRQSGSIKLFVDGTQVGSTYSNSTSFSGAIYVGAELYNGTIYATTNGYIDDFRITKGYARYTANFTAPTAAFALQ